MSNNKMGTVDDIIDLTDVVSIGSGVGMLQEDKQAQDDVLDSLVNELAENKQNSDEDSSLDLSNLDNLISSYNLDLDDGNTTDDELNTDFDAILNDIKNEHNGAEEEINFAKPQTDIFEQQEQLDTENIVPLSEDDEIDRLTKDIIDGTDNEGELKNNLASDFSYDAPNLDSANQADQTGQAEKVQELQPEIAGDAFLEELDNHLGEDSVDLSTKRAVPSAEVTGDTLSSVATDTEKPAESLLSQGFSTDVLNVQNSFNEENEDIAQTVEPDTIKKSSKQDDFLISDMASLDQAEDISDETLNDIFNDLSLEHESDEDVVPFAKEAGAESMAIKLNGDVSFIENQNSKKTPNTEDVHLVQSASKVLDSDEAYLEKFDGADESLEGKLKNLSTSLISMEQRLNGSDSKWQDTGLQLNYRISGLETRLSALEENTRKDISVLQSKLDSSLEKFSESLQAINEKSVNNDHSINEQLAEKVSALETRLATLDDIFSEQKMLNDELAKTLDTMQPSANNCDYIQQLEDKIAALQNELIEAQSKIVYLEKNIENAASLAAAKVLREEIIPLLSKG